MPTIVQNYGPIYGEVVNGTVQGRPNGSIYVPISNTMEIQIDQTTTIYIKRGNVSGSQPNRIYTAENKSFNLIAQSQDLASYIETAVYSDNECTAMVGTSVRLTAGIFNYPGRFHIGNTTEDLIPNTTYYIRAALMNNKVAIAYSDIIEVVSVDSE